jgi:hypothetical protein
VAAGGDAVDVVPSAPDDFGPGRPPEAGGFDARESDAAGLALSDWSHPMNAQAVEALIEKLKSLPPEQRAEVEDYVDFLRTRKERARDAAAQRLGEAFKELDALNQAPPTAKEVHAVIPTMITCWRVQRPPMPISSSRATKISSICTSIKASPSSLLRMRCNV